MAIDTAAKRRSAAHVARKWSGAGVTPDATPDGFWRQCVGRGYAGILAGAASAAAFVQYMGIRIAIQLGI